MVEFQRLDNTFLDAVLFVLGKIFSIQAIDVQASVYTSGLKGIEMIFLIEVSIDTINATGVFECRFF
jgi:hypothetical protein